MLFAFLVPNTVAFAFDDDARVNGFKRFVLNQVMPNVCAVVFNDFLNVIGGHRVHLRHLSVVCGGGVSDSTPSVLKFNKAEKTDGR